MADLLVGSVSGSVDSFYIAKPVFVPLQNFIRYLGKLQLLFMFSSLSFLLSPRQTLLSFL